MAGDCWKQWLRLTPGPIGRHARGRKRLENEEAAKLTGRYEVVASGGPDLIGRVGNGRRPDGYMARRDTAAGQEAGGMTPRPARAGELQEAGGVRGASDTLTRESRRQNGKEQPVQ